MVSEKEIQRHFEAIVKANSAFDDKSAPEMQSFYFTFKEGWEAALKRLPDPYRYIIEECPENRTIAKYLSSNPHPDYRLVTLDRVFDDLYFVWERNDG